MSAGRSPACWLLCGYRTPTDWKRDGGTEDVLKIVELFDPGQPFDVGTKAFRRAVGVACAKQIGYPPGRAIALKGQSGRSAV
jgi:hypothetical protein